MGFGGGLWFPPGGFLVSLLGDPDPPLRFQPHGLKLPSAPLLTPLHQAGRFLHMNVNPNTCLKLSVFLRAGRKKHAQSDEYGRYPGRWEWLLANLTLIFPGHMDLGRLAHLGPILARPAPARHLNGLWVLTSDSSFEMPPCSPVTFFCFLLSCVSLWVLSSYPALHLCTWHSLE